MIKGRPTPKILELVAKNILLSLGGTIYVPYKDLSFPVRNETDGAVTERYITDIHFTPGQNHGVYAYFNNGFFAIITDEKDRKRAYDYIYDLYESPDKDIPWDEETLQERLFLRERNIRFILEHGDLEPDDYQMIRTYQKAIAAQRDAIKDNPHPLPGDIVEGAYYNGSHEFNNGIIESKPHWKKPLSVCAVPYVPFISFADKNEERISTSVSGGPFFGLNPEDLEYIGEDKRFFCDWGHEGPCRDGSIEFQAKVNRWRIKEHVDY